MTSVIVTSARPGGGNTDDALVEQITLNFAIVKIEYYRLNSDGSVDPPIEIIYDIAAGKIG